MELSTSSSPTGSEILAEYSGQSSKLDRESISFFMTTTSSLVDTTRGNFSFEASRLIGTLIDFKFPLVWMSPLDLLLYPFEELRKFLLDF